MTNHRLPLYFAGTIKTVEMEEIRSKRWGETGSDQRMICADERGREVEEVRWRGPQVTSILTSVLLVCALCAQSFLTGGLSETTLCPRQPEGCFPPALSIERNWTRQVSYCQSKGLDIQYEEEKSCCRSLKSTFYLTTFVEFTSEKRRVLTRRCRDYMLFYFSTQITSQSLISLLVLCRTTALLSKKILGQLKQDTHSHFGSSV